MSARAALAADGLDPAAHSILGLRSAFTGKHDDALAMGQKGVELNPSNAFGYWGLGLTYMLRGEPEQGIRAIETAIRISPNDVLLPLWLTTLARVHYSGAQTTKDPRKSRGSPCSARHTIPSDGAASPTRSASSARWTRRAKPLPSSSR